MTGPVDPLARSVVAELGGRGVTLATAESLTAGLVSARIADVPGASSVLRGGLVVYATDLKHVLAGVPEAVLALHGAVSEETARALAEGARRVCGADVGVGLTGVAGPDRQEGHEVGTVFVAVAGPGHGMRVVAPRVPGDRAAKRNGACRVALEEVLSALGNDPRG